MSAVRWSPREDDGFRYEAAQVNGKKLAVWHEPGEGWRANVGGFPLRGSFGTAAKAKAAAVTRAAA